MTLGYQLAEVLASETKGNALKLIGWARDLAVGRTLTLDAADFKWLREYVDSSERMVVQLKGPILETLDEQEREAKEPKTTEKLVEKAINNGNGAKRS